MQDPSNNVLKLKVEKEREKGEFCTFELSVNLIFTFSYVTLMYLVICAFAINLFHTFLYVLMSYTFVYDSISFPIRTSL